MADDLKKALMLRTVKGMSEQELNTDISDRHNDVRRNILNSSLSEQELADIYMRRMNRTPEELQEALQAWSHKNKTPLRQTLAHFLATVQTPAFKTRDASEEAKNAWALVTPEEETGFNSEQRYGRRRPTFNTYDYYRGM